MNNASFIFQIETILLDISQILHVTKLIFVSPSCSFIRRTIRTGHVSWRLPHWKMCKLYDVPSSIRMDAFIRLVRIRKHSAFANIRHCPRSGKRTQKLIVTLTKKQTQKNHDISRKMSHGLKKRRTKNEPKEISL